MRATILPLAWAAARPNNPPERPGFREALRARRVAVIFLHRRNMLRWHVSYLVAQQGGVWIACLPERGPRPPVWVDEHGMPPADPGGLAHQHRARRFFAGHRCLDLWYEDLVNDFDAQMDTVQRFLGLVPQQLRPTCVKQENRPLCEAIANFDQLRSAWRGTRWEQFLRDETEPGVGLADEAQLRPPGPPHSGSLAARPLAAGHRPAEAMMTPPGREGLPGCRETGNGSVGEQLGYGETGNWGMVRPETCRRASRCKT